MADENIKQVMLDAITDADSLERFINGSEDETVLTRLSAEYPTLRKAIKTLFENGGLPATPFATKALMTASSLVDGDYAIVTDDITNDGLYVKTAGVWSKSSYGSVYDVIVSSLVEVVPVISNPQPTYTNTNEVWALQLGQLTKITSDSGYLLSSPIAVPAGKILRVVSTGGYYYPVVEVSETGLYLSHLNSFKSGSGTYTIDTPISSELKYYSACGRPFTATLIDGFTPQIKKTKYEEDLAAMSAESKLVYDDLGNLLPVLSYYEEKLEFESGTFRWTPPSYKENNQVDTLYFDVTEGQTVKLQYDENIDLSMLYYGEKSDILSGPDKYWSLGFNYSGFDVPYTGSIIAVVPSGAKVLIDGNVATPIETKVGIEYYQTKALLSNSDTVRSKEDISLKEGDTIELSEVALGSANIIDVSASPNKILISTPYIGGLWENKSVSYTAPKDMLVRVSLHKDGTAKIIRKGGAFKNALEADIQKTVASELTRVGGGNLDIPDELQLPEMEYVFATAMNYILKLETKDDGIEYIAMSTDLGKTWNYTENIIGDIVQYHFFSDGTVMLCSPTKVWYSSDYQTFTESTVLDLDGNPFVPTGRHFFSQQNSDKVMIKEGKEIFVWGDYIVDSTPCRIWYSLDYGRTIKCAARFGVTPMGGSPRSTRHVHRVNYRTKDGKFYITTGDVGNDCMVIKADYSFDTDTWEWEVLASGDEFKFGSIYFDDVFAYLVTDYTVAHLRDKKGIYRTPVHKIGDYSSYVPVYKADPAEWGSIALSRLVVDRDNGYTVLLPDYLGFGVIWIAKNGFNFKKVNITPKVLLGYSLGANYNGDVYCVVYNSVGELNTPSALKLSRGSINITKAIRDAGFPNFMRFNPLSMPSGSVTEQP